MNSPLVGALLTEQAATEEMTTDQRLRVLEGIIVGLVSEITGSNEERKHLADAVDNLAGGLKDIALSLGSMDTQLGTLVGATQNINGNAISQAGSLQDIATAVNQLLEHRKKNAAWWRRLAENIGSHYDDVDNGPF